MPTKITFYLNSGARLSLTSSIRPKKFHDTVIASLGNKDSSSLTLRNPDNDEMFTIIPRGILANSVMQIEEINEITKTKTGRGVGEIERED